METVPMVHTLHIQAKSDKTGEWHNYEQIAEISPYWSFTTLSDIVREWRNEGFTVVTVTSDKGDTMAEGRADGSVWFPDWRA